MLLRGSSLDSPFSRAPAPPKSDFQWPLFQLYKLFCPRGDRRSMSCAGSPSRSSGEPGSAHALATCLFVRLPRAFFRPSRPFTRILLGWIVSSHGYLPLFFTFARIRCRLPSCIPLLSPGVGLASAPCGSCALTLMRARARATETSRGNRGERGGPDHGHSSPIWLGAHPPLPVGISSHRL